MSNYNKLSRSRERPLKSKPKATMTVSISMEVAVALNKTFRNFKSKSECVEHFLIEGLKKEGKI